MMNGEKLVTAILTQAVDDARYTGTRKKYLKHKIEALNWIKNDDPQFKYYCRLLNIEPSYIKNKISGHVDAKITKEQQPIATAIISAMSKNKNNEQRRR
tara:strand:+ start:1207 stop:1503 length:297 start_codon:yes stop_codon:yes gene_type:complete